MLPSSHPGPTVIEVPTDSEMGENSKKSLAKMYENDNLKNGVRVQVCQIQIVEIKETAEKRIDGNSKSADEKCHVDNGFMGVLCRNSDPTPDPPRTEFFWRQNPSLNKVEKIRLRDNGHMITSEWKLAVGIDGRDDRSSDALSLPFGRHCNLSGGTSGLSNLEKQRSGRGKSEVRARKSKSHVGTSINGLLGSDITSKVTDHHSEKVKASIVTRTLPLKCQHCQTHGQTFKRANENQNISDYLEQLHS
jgi:hypothetical protein